jgi:hypothetical protein
VSLLLNLMFSAIGSGYLVYAKKQYSARFAIFGALLAVFPYFVENVLLMVLIGAALAAAPFVMDRFS